MIKNIFLRDFSFFIPAIFLSVFGLSTIFALGTQNFLFEKQSAIFILGLSLAIIISLIDFSFLKKGHFTFVFYLIMTTLLLLLLFLGKVYNGAQSWFHIFGISFEPVEFAKLSLIFILAKFFHARHMDISHIPTIIVSALYPLILFLLTILHPDLGSALVILGIWGFIVFCSGIPKKYIFGISVIAIALSIFTFEFLLVQYQRDRILNFVTPTRDVRGGGYNVYQSMIAIGSGGLWGKGINFGTQSKLQFLPEYQTDFVFAAFAEEWGYIGVIFSIIIFYFIIFKFLYLAQKTDSNFETLVLIGFAAYFIIHSSVNIGMNLGVLPVTGIPLPFMSSGGTHILVEWIMVGVAASISKNSRRLNREIHQKELFI